MGLAFHGIDQEQEMIVQLPQNPVVDYDMIIINCGTALLEYTGNVDMNFDRTGASFLVGHVIPGHWRQSIATASLASIQWFGQLVTDVSGHNSSSTALAINPGWAVDSATASYDATSNKVQVEVQLAASNHYSMLLRVAYHVTTLIKYVAME
jgi:hypothetical protein